jgi:hypothetical protein
MKLNLTATLTLIWLAIMLSAGTLCGWLGYTLGFAALKGVTQPDINPARKLSVNNQEDKKQKEAIVVSEKAILVKVYNYIYAQEGKEQTKAGTQKNNNSSIFAKTDQNSDQKTKFPLKGQDQGVTLEIVKATQQEGSLLLDVNLKNDGTQIVRFLYSFLDIRDEKGQAKSVVTDGLPEELPANGENFSGTMRIPMTSLEDAQIISLTLTDYPEQKIELNIPEIPVVR